MICPPCRGEYYSLVGVKKGDPVHDECINFVKITSDGEIEPRDEPISSCFCQHKASWNFSVGGKEKTGDHDGNSSQS